MQCQARTPPCCARATEATLRAVRTMQLTWPRSGAAPSSEVSYLMGHGSPFLGLAALGTDDEEALEDVKNVLYSDSAVAGEAAGIGLGLLCCGSGGERVAAEALAYAHDTQHEKIIRGALAMEGNDVQRAGVGAGHMRCAHDTHSTGRHSGHVRCGNGVPRFVGSVRVGLCSVVGRRVRVAGRQHGRTIWGACTTTRNFPPACCNTLRRMSTALEPIQLEACVTTALNRPRACCTGVALGLALMQYGREEAAEALIEQMTRDADPIIRYGGMYVIGMAYR